MLINTRNRIFAPTAISLLVRFLVYLHIPLLSVYFKNLGMSDKLLGAVFSFFPLILILSSPVIGNLADALGRKRIIYAGVFFTFLGVVLYLWPPTIASVIAGRVVSAIGWAMVVMITMAKVEDKITDSERGVKSGVFFSISYIGLLLGPIVGTFLAEIFFLRFSFIMSAIGLALLLVWMYTWKSHHKVRVRKKDFDPLAALKKFWSDKRLRSMGFVGMAMHSRMAVVEVFLPLLVLSLGAGYKEIGIIFFFRGISHLFQGAAGKMVDKKGSSRIVVASVIASSVFIIFAGFAQSYTLLLFILFLEGLANAFWNISAWTFMSGIGEAKNIEGAVAGSYSSIARIGHFVFAIASGFIVAALGINSLFFISGGISLLAVLALSGMLIRKPSKNAA